MGVGGEGVLFTLTPYLPLASWHGVGQCRFVADDTLALSAGTHSFMEPLGDPALPLVCELPKPKRQDGHLRALEDGPSTVGVLEEKPDGGIEDEDGEVRDGEAAAHA